VRLIFRLIDHNCNYLGLFEIFGELETAYWFKGPARIAISYRKGMTRNLLLSPSTN